MLTALKLQEYERKASLYKHVLEYSADSSYFNMHVEIKFQQGLK